MLKRINLALCAVALSSCASSTTVALSSCAASTINPSLVGTDPYYICPPETTLSGAEDRLAAGGWLINRSTNIYVQTMPRLMTPQEVQMHSLMNRKMLERETLRITVVRTSKGLYWRLDAVTTMVAKNVPTVVFPLALGTPQDEMSDNMRAHFNRFRYLACGDSDFLQPKPAT